MLLFPDTIPTLLTRDLRSNEIRLHPLLSLKGAMITILCVTKNANLRYHDHLFCVVPWRNITVYVWSMLEWSPVL